MHSPWAVVTGASAGLGVHYAERLAEQGSNLILAARSADKLADVADDLRRRHGVTVEVRAVDLATEAGRADFVDEIRGTHVHTLINNAGFASVGSFSELDADRVQQEVSLNAGALTELTHAVVGPMVARGRGAIVNVSSTSAFQAMAGMAVYAATKGYVLQFSVGLWAELHDTGVRVLAVCPGPTDTSFFANAGNDDVLRRRRRPEQVIDATFKALAEHRPFVVDGARNKLVAFSNRLVPRSFAARLAPTYLRIA
ncbi:MAG: SDR family oxidoreductase [Propionibacterium sp.]|nr:SDR family oxidoreductase [Propionibacterium sp.]